MDTVINVNNLKDRIINLNMDNDQCKYSLYIIDRIESGE